MIGSHRAVEPLLHLIPSEWEVARFKALFARSDTRNGDLSAPMLSLRTTGELVDRATLGQRQEPDEASLPRYFVADEGNLVVNPMWLVGGAIGVATSRGAVSPDYRVFKTKSHHPKYVHYLLRTPYYFQQYRLYTRAQTTFDRRVQQPDLDNMPMPVPPMGTQVQVADYLDRETAQIDTFIAEQEHLIGLLHERRTAVVHGLLEATDGHRVPLRHLASVQTGVTLGGDGNPDDPEWSYLRVANVQTGHLDLREIKTLRISEQRARASLLQVGDVLMTEGGDLDKLGRGALWPGSVEPMLHQNHLFAVRPTERLLPEYLVYWLEGSEARNYFRNTAKKTTNIAATNKWTLSRLPVWCPSVDRQKNIVQRLDAQTRGIRQLITEAERFIELARERRSALITAAVTGQIEIPEAS